MTLATSKYTAPACAASKGNHFKVSSGATYLQTAIDKSDPAIKARALNDAQRVILEGCPAIVAHALQSFLSST